MNSSNSLEQTLIKISKSSLGYAAPLELRRALESVKAAREVAAVCLVFRGDDFLASEILLTERSLTLPTHAGQVAFPGGLLEAGDQGNTNVTAMRECEEEVGVSKELLKVVGQLPPFPTMVGQFEVTPVLALCARAGGDEGNPTFKLSDEVSFAEWVSVQALLASREEEIRMVQDVEVKSPYFLWGKRKMWGVSAWIFDLLYQRYATLN